MYYWSLCCTAEIDRTLSINYNKNQKHFLICNKEILEKTIDIHYGNILCDSKTLGIIINLYRKEYL